MVNHENRSINQLPDANPMPYFKLYSLREIGSGVLNLLGRLSPLPSHVDVHTSPERQERIDHATAHMMLENDEARKAYEQLRIEFDSKTDLKDHDWTQYPDLGYDDCGNYTNNVSGDNWDVV